MKFGSQLEAHAIPEWADRYIKYKDLKKWLSRRSAEIEKVAFVSVLARAAAAIHAADPPVPADSHRSEPLDSHRRRRGSETAEGPPDRSQLLAAAISDFAEEMEHELRKVEHHFNKERGFLLDRLEGVEFEVQSIEAKHMNSGDRKAAEQAVEAHRQRLQRAIISIWDIFEKLDSYVQLNTIAVYKILKKRNKMLGIDDSGDDLQHHRNRLAQLRMGEELKNRLLNLYHRASQPDEEYIEDFATIRAAVQREMLNMQRFPNLRALFFALGATAVLIVNVIVLLTAEASNPRYSISAVLALLPIYRLLLMLVALHWGLATSFAVCEAFGVNYRFILSIDPKCRVASTHMFTACALQSLVLVVGFGCYVADFKFLVFGDHERYWVHLVLQIFAQLLLLLWPSETFRYRYRRAAALLVLETFTCGVLFPVEVTLVANVCGDILTSLAKPLGDLQYSVCFFVTGLDHPQPAKCSADSWTVPMLAGFPYWIRLVQCYSRYLSSRKGSKQEARRHILNVGKYAASLAVLLLTAISWNMGSVSVYVTRLFWVFAYIVATVYSFIWDVYIDWGLLPDVDNFVRVPEKCMYPVWLYHAVGVFNLAGRMTWAMTLMPIALLGNASLEICRRSAWLAIRLENEHLTNSSRYRAMLWVPKLDVQALNAPRDEPGT
eukprot:Polyplicarium_translucidae@DN2047_c0_g1_i2.p1